MSGEEEGAWDLLRVESELGYPPFSVSPAKAGVHMGPGLRAGSWIPAFAGKTEEGAPLRLQAAGDTH